MNLIAAPAAPAGPTIMERVAAHRRLTATISITANRTPEQIADAIRAAGITGEADSISSCPVGKWLAEEAGGPGTWATYVGSEFAVYSAQNMQLARTRIPHTHPIAELVGLIADGDPEFADLVDAPGGEADRAESFGAAPVSAEEEAYFSQFDCD